MPLRKSITLIAVFAVLYTQACRDADRPHPLTPVPRRFVEANVRAFAAAVAHDVTQDGPSAWTKYFADTPVFFMAVDGQLAFPSGQAAANAIPQIARQYKHIQLNWGDDLRLDVLTDHLCVVAASYTEILELNPGATGPRGTQHGYFTAIAENQNNRWQFRNAHWSTQPAVAKLR
jgi:hypothetical protein